MKRKSKKRVARLLVCYGVALLLWAGACGIALLADTLRTGNGGMQTLALNLMRDTAPSSIKFSPEFAEDHSYTATDDDPYFFVEWPQGFVLRRVEYAGHTVGTAIAGGEMRLYYTTAPGQQISPRRYVTAQPAAGGGWCFDMGGRRVYQLRFDPGTVAGAMWQGDTLLLNAPMAAGMYFVPGWRAVFALLFGPLLAWAVWGEVLAFMGPLFARRRFERRWRRKPAR